MPRFKVLVERKVEDLLDCVVEVDAADEFDAAKRARTVAGETGDWQFRFQIHAGRPVVRETRLIGPESRG
jgi:hypothetical protein